MSVGRALVYGGRGALGSTVVKAFKVGLMALNIFLLPSTITIRREAGGWLVWI